MSESPSSSSRASSHTRHPSRRQALLRQSTAGPLGDGDDPLTARPPSAGSPRPSSIPDRTRSSTPSRSSPVRTPQLSATDKLTKSFAFLLRPEIYNDLTYDDIPPPFREHAPEEPEATSLENLLTSGRFLSAAILSATQLKNESNITDYKRVFNLLYTRLACLQVLGLHELAAQESRALQDLDSDFYRDQETGTHLAPWELRVLAVRLQALGFGDWRRGIMSYYELAREARIAARSATSDEEKQLWKSRLSELGIKVANALVEMDDLQGALRHLHSLSTSKTGQKASTLRIVLLYLTLGNVKAAKKYLESTAEDSQTVTGMLKALIQMCDGNYDEAAQSWNQLLNEGSSTEDIVIRGNLAVCLLYAGKVLEAREVLKQLAKEDNMPRITSFNLSTVFELCSDQAVHLKQQLAKQISERDYTSTGWEKLNSEFKL